MAAPRMRSEPALLPHLEHAVQVVEKDRERSLRLGSARLDTGQHQLVQRETPSARAGLPPLACTMESGTRMERVHEDIS